MYGCVNEKGVNIYRCHRHEVGPGSTCGYWIAYEEKILPFLFRRVLPDLRQYIDAQVTARPRPAPAPSGGELEGLREELKRLDSKLERGRERFLEADADLSPGLKAILQKWEAERKELQGRINALTAGEGKDWVFLLAAKTLEVGFIGVPVPTGDPPIVTPDGFSGLPYSFVPAPVVRESFKRISARVSVWFRPKAKGRGYDMSKVRVEAEVGGRVCNEYSSKGDYTIVHVPGLFVYDMLMIGSPGTGKSMLAQRLPTILPPLTPAESLETTRIYSAMGRLSPDEPLMRQRPFRTPHHTISDAGMVGGGSTPAPGEISLAHHGVNCRSNHLLNSLRQPLAARRLGL
jgi:hypothetical protein